mgnify:CR=1 FL=1
MEIDISLLLLRRRRHSLLSRARARLHLHTHTHLYMLARRSRASQPMTLRVAVTLLAVTLLVAVAVASPIKRPHHIKPLSSSATDTPAAATPTPPGWSKSFLSANWRIETSAHLSPATTGKIISSSSYDASSWLPTSMPATVMAALVQNGVYQDPYYSLGLEAIPVRLLIIIYHNLS